MTDSQTKLKSLLRELFQLDNADLDFGIYRIMNAKRVEVEGFLDNDLLPQVKKAFEQYQSSDSVGIKAELAKTIQQAKEMGVADPEALPKVKDLRTTLAGAVDVSALENQVFSDLYNFFRRYYSDGDFLSLRRYKEGVYAIPYEGEEVKLYWANHDQYYIKSTEYLRDYAFRLSGNQRVHFRLATADTEKDNAKPKKGLERRFVLAAQDPVREIAGDLHIFFEYRFDVEERTQEELNSQAILAILSAKSAERWAVSLSRQTPTTSAVPQTNLSKHLADFTARNRFDYFIHKHIGTFLNRELDFFIKNEVMHLDDIESASVPKVEEYLARVKVLRSIARKIIHFVSQLEDFQKSLWLKKKFVVANDYCVTLSMLPESLLPRIAANALQVAEWKALYQIHHEKVSRLGEHEFSEPPDVDFLKQHPSLVVDTRHFDHDFKSEVLRAIRDISAEVDGVLIKGENFQGLSLVSERDRGTVRTIYIDPPYNTKKDIFPYKDGYKHGTWLSMLVDRLTLAHELLSEDGVLFCSIDKHEMPRLSQVLEEVFGPENYVGEIVWRNARDNNPTQIAMEHEYIVCFAKNISKAESVWKNSFSDAKELLQQEYNRLKALSLGVSEIQDKLREFIKDNEESLGEVDRYKFVDEAGVYTGSQSVHNPHPGGYQYEILHPVTNQPMRIPGNGYRFPWDTMKRDYIDANRLLYGPDHNRIVQIKLLLKDYQDSLRSVIDLDGRLGAYALGTLFGKKADPFDNPKPPQLMKRLLAFGSKPGAVVLDFFAGSGSTLQATIEVGREVNQPMKFIAMEMGEHFDTVLLPRLKKLTYSDSWQDGTPEHGQSRKACFQCIQLESYEDSLNNLELTRQPAQQSLLETNAAVREDYTLRYMLELETKGSPSLLNITAFASPFDYVLNIATSTVGESKPITVDLVETFNWLLGLRVNTIDTIKGVRVVTGTSPQGEKVLVLWRNVKEMPNVKLDEFFQKQGYSTKDMEFDIIYVNGDNNLENLKKDEDTWKVRLIEDDFKRLMFDVQDV
jgi:adenine-specific DNA-methyltransferase